MDIYLDLHWQILEVITVNGSLILEKNLGGQTGRISIPLPAATNGVCIARLRSGAKVLTQKIVTMQ